MKFPRLLLPLIGLLAVPLAARQYGYDAAGRVVWTIQPGGQSTSFAYDANGNLEAIASITPGDDTDTDGIPDYFELQFSGLTNGLNASANDDDDPNDNLVEFAFALRPDTADGFTLAPVSISAPDGMGDQFYRITYLRPQSGPTHLSYTTEVSFDLLTWDDNSPDIVETVVPLDGGIEQVTVEFTSAVGVDDVVFLRVDVQPL